MASGKASDHPEIDAVDLAIKGSNDKRAHQQGVIRNYLNRLDNYMVVNQSEDIPACVDILKKLPDAVDRYNRYHEELVSICEKHNVDTKEIKEKTSILQRDMRTTVDDTKRWMTTVTAPGDDLDSTNDSLMNVTMKERSISLEDMSAIVSEKTTEFDADDYETLVKQKEVEIRDLQDKLYRSMRLGQEKDILEDNLQTAQAVIQQQAKDHKEEELRFKSTIQRMQEQMNARSQDTMQRGYQMPKATSSPKREIEPQKSNLSMTQDDLMAMTTMIGQTNSDMMKQLLDETHVQQKRFYSHLTGPKVELKHFDGDMTTYVFFQNRFDELVGSTDRSFSSKLSSLIDHCGPTVSPFLESCNYRPPEDGYKEAIRILKQRYGNPYLISQAWIKKISDVSKVKTPQQMSHFSAILQSAVDSLKSMGYESELTCTRTMKEVYDKLPTFVQNKWLSISRDRTQKGRNATLHELLALISNTSLEMNDPIYGNPNTTGKTEEKKSNEKEKTQKPFVKKRALAATEKEIEKPSLFTDRKADSRKGGEPPECSFCKKTHPTYKCFLYKDLGSAERLDFVNKNKLCLCCLATGHKASECPRKWKCLMNECGKDHHFSLHRALTEKKQPEKKPATSVQKEDADDVTTAECLPTRVVHVKPCYTGGIRLNPNFILPAIPVELTGTNGRVCKTYAMLDSGSAVTMIKQSVMDTLQLKPVARACMVLAGVNSDSDIDTDVVDLMASESGNPVQEKLRNVVVNDSLNLGTKIAKEMKRYKTWKHLQHLDIKHHASDEISMLIGQDNAYLLLHEEKIAGPNKYFPYGIKTRLGWTMFGHFPDQIPRYLPVKKVSSCVVQEDRDNELSKTLEELWEIDKVPDASGYSPINRQILKRWDEETKLVNGHFQVPIPFKKEPPCLPNNYAPVKARLDALSKRLEKDPKLREQYVATMKKNIDLGFLEKAPLHPDTDYLNYTPQMPVLSDTRSTKCRIVGNLSFKAKGVSLNDAVYQGPNMATHIVQVMIGFRTFRYVITGDIEKMFNQVHVPPYQRDSLSVLWFKDHEPGGEVEVYRGRTQMFGGTWCPAASMYALKKSAEMFGHEYMLQTVEAIQKGFYVDDLLRSIVSISIGLRLITEIREILARGGFNLTKFGSNAIELMEAIPKELRNPKYEAIEFTLDKSIKDSTLGSQWSPANDEFSIKLDEAEKPMTRRGLLSSFSTIYDPLGFVGPVVLLAKLIIQELCRMGISWDETIPEEYVQKWLMWKEDLPELKNYTVKRWLGVDPETENDYQLHVFSDASEKGYGAVAYLCELDEVGEIINSNIVMSKCKVSPMKNMTIPRLELLAAVVAAKMENMIVNYMEVSLLPSVFWVDSKIVLHYIKQQSRSYKTFVANRIAIIQNHTKPSQWRYVPSTHNIADLLSRGALASDFTENREWKTGPGFLRNISEWPERLPDLPEEEVDTERRVHSLQVKKQEDDYDPVAEKTINKFLHCISQWGKKIRAIAILKRMVKKHKGKPYETGPITVKEYEESELIVVKHSQRHGLSEEQKKSKSFQKLFPFDNDGLYRVGGRLMLSNLRYEEKHPIIMPKGETAKSYIRYIHARLGHPGIERTYYETRKSYWILGGRKFVKETLNSCVTCRKLKAKPMEQQMAPLPEKRINTGTAPFEHVGIDYFGPIQVKIARSMHKRWCCVITCFQTRATHVEVASDLSTSAFLNVLQRFIARRGRPKSIRSDNGSNFIGAKSELKKILEEWNKKQIHDYLLDQGIEWHFNTPLASHHGGVWERQIRTIRQLMMSIIKEQTLTDDSLHTYMCAIEEIINSRPLTSLTEDAQDLLPLTPNHLLLLRQTKGLTGVFTQADTLKRKWKQLQYMSDLFWKKWLNSYVKSLQERTKWMKKKENVKVGDLVLVVKESVPRNTWPMARILQVFEGKDGLVRSVRIKTLEGEYERPITKLVSLECDV